MDPVDDLRRTARTVAVPGAPLSLRVDGAERRGEAVRVAWSYVDPTGEVERLGGSTVVDADDDPSATWAAAQLDAADHLRLHLDLDTLPGRPWEPRTYGRDEAWELLLGHLGRWGEVVVGDGVPVVVAVRDGDRRLRGTVRVNREGWVRYLNQFDHEAGAPADDALWVPAAVAEVDGLPLWADDELTEMIGSCTHVAVRGHEIVCADPPVDP